MPDRETLSEPGRLPVLAMVTVPCTECPGPIPGAEKIADPCLEFEIDSEPLTDAIAATGPEREPGRDPGPEATARAAPTSTSSATSRAACTKAVILSTSQTYLDAVERVLEWGQDPCRTSAAHHPRSGELSLGRI